MQAALADAAASPSNRTAPSVPAALLLAVILCAFFFRVYNLSHESLDIDEADAVFFALADVPTLVGRITQPGENGPLYFLLLRLWMGLAGASEFSLRYFSLVPGVLSVPLLFVLGKRLLSARVGLTAAFLGAVSSYLLFYAQMAKMYSLVLLVGLLSAYLLLRAVEQHGGRYWAGYTLITTAALYTHVFSALLLPWHALYVLERLRRQRAILVPWLVSLAALTLPYLPLGLQRLAALGAPESLNRQPTGPQEPLGMLGALAREYGTRFDLAPPEVLAGAFLALTAFGLLALLGGLRAAEGPATAALPAHGAGRLLQEHRESPAPFLALGLLVPLLLTYLLVLWGLPLFASRYLITTLPVFYLLWATALSALAARSKGLALLVLMGFVLVNGARWGQSALGGERFREDWRSAVAYLAARYTPGDLVLVLHHSAGRAVRYYASKPLFLADLDGGGGRPPNPDQVGALPATGRLWLLAAYFEVGDLPPVEGWLDQRGQLVSKKWHVGVMVSQYLVKQGAPQSPKFMASAAVMGEGLRLRGYRPGPLPDRAGAPWLLTLEWEGLEGLGDSYHASARLLDGQGRAWGHFEGPIGGQFYPTERWPAGFTVMDVWEVALLPDTPPGSYTLAVRFYRRSDLQPLAVTLEGHERLKELTLGPFTLAAPAPPAP